MEFNADITIERPVAAAFEACDDPQVQPHWAASLISVERDPGQVWGENATFRQIHEEAGTRQVFEGTILAYQPNQRIRMRLVHADFELVSELSFEDLGSHCRVSNATEVELRSMALKLMKGVMKGVVQKRLDEDLQRLKALLESVT